MNLKVIIFKTKLFSISGIYGITVLSTNYFYYQKLNVHKMTYFSGHNFTNGLFCNSQLFQDTLGTDQGEISLKDILIVNLSNLETTLKIKKILVIKSSSKMLNSCTDNESYIAVPPTDKTCAWVCVHLGCFLGKQKYVILYIKWKGGNDDENVPEETECWEQLKKKVTKGRKKTLALSHLSW